MSLILIVSISLLVGVISYYVWIWSYWIRRGVRGPRGFPFTGVIGDMQKYEKPFGLQLKEWTKEFGPIYGITEGVNKTLIVSDPEIVNEVFVKQFDNFYGRKLNPLQGDPNKNKRVHMLASQGHRWKRLRTLSAPTFSNKNLRKIMGTVEITVTEFMRHLDKGVANGKTVNMLDYYQEFTLDVIGKIAMGQTDSLMFRNPMLPKVKRIFGDTRKWTFQFLGVFPIFGVFLRYLFSKFPKMSPAFDIMNVMEKAVESRIAQRESDAKRGIEIGEPQDFIDLFLDAQADVDFFDGERKEASNFAQSQIGKVDKHLTFDEIIGQCFVFLIAGYDTTALSLSYTSYLLATNPEAQRKLQEEVDKECPDPEVTFDQLSKLKYMECVIKEALRMYPLASIVHSRKCMRDTNVCGMEIEEGTHVQVDTWSLHYDKTIWGENADEFHPERWESEGDFHNKKGYLPFGLGPRICIGMRLAYMEEKMLLTQILKKYTFETTSSTVIPPTLVGRATIAPTSVLLKLTPRHSD